jgi:hypothetical protein
MQDDAAERHPQSGTLLFSERQKRQAELEQEVREYRQSQTPLFDRIHRGKYVYISKEGKTRTKKIVFPQP